MLAVIIEWSIFGAICLGGALTGKYAHELTHAAVALILGSPDVHVDWIQSTTYFAVPDTWSVWEHRAVLLAPQAIGLTLAAVYVATVGFPPWNAWGFGIGFAWFWYTLRGGRADFSTSQSLAEGDEYTQARKEDLTDFP